LNEILSALAQRNIPYLEGEPMSRHTTFKTGGSARLFVEPGDERALSETLRLCAQYDETPFILGNGSNLLVSDDGMDRVVVHIGDGIDFVRSLGGGMIEVGAGATLAKLCKFALEESLTGLEFAYGIPGSVGGAVFMNAGAYGGEMKDVVQTVRFLTKAGCPGELSGDALGFCYRGSVFQTLDVVITSVVLKLTPGDPTAIEEKMRELLGRRRDKQPLEYPSAGSVFKRPEGHFAGALIEQCGLKGKTIGGAQVSEKHAGFIINIGGATTKDVTDLIAYCQSVVLEQCGVQLEPEIKRV
jgi:UDP-N-acetylmuramate dehydrogenase